MKELEQWRRALQIDKARRTVQTYTQAVEKFAAWIDTPLDKWEPDDLVRYLHCLEERGNAPSTRRLYGVALGQFGKFLVKRDVWAKNQFDIDLPKPPNGERPHVIEKTRLIKGLRFEANSILDHRDRALLWVLYAGALRATEARELKDEHLDVEQGRLIDINGKGDKIRTIPLTDVVGQEALENLEAYLKIRDKLHDDNEYIFWGRRPAEHQSEPLSYGAIYASVKRWLGDGVTPHDLRRSRLSHLADAGLPTAMLKRLAGHARIQTTLRYYIDVNNDAMAQTMAGLG